MTDPATLVHVVDDDLAVRDSLRWLLEGEGLVVQTYASGEEFLAAFTNERPGCVIVDLRMPGMSGLELQAELARRHVRLPLVFVTAFLDRNTFRKFAPDIAWETEVWIAQEPDHMIHFNGDRFIGPRKKAGDG